jgi:DnaJ-class molecular chaperone
MTGTIPKPLTSGHLCPSCNGTGADAEKTMHKDVTKGSYVRCWDCNGNGLDPSAYFRFKD